MKQITKSLLAASLSAVFLLNTVTAFAQEREFKGGSYVACLTEDLLDQFISAASSDDIRGMDYLLKNGCLSPRAGIPVSVLDSTWTGTVHVRAYASGQAMELWTVREALTEE